MLPRHEYERAYKLHRQKLETIKPHLDNNPPKQYPHLLYRHKQIQNHEEKLSKVDYENKILLHKMTHIMKTGGRVDNWNDKPAKRSHDPYKNQKHHQMMTENVQMARRLEAVKPTYDRQEWEEDYKKHEQYLEMRDESNKDNIYESSSRRKKKDGKDDYDSDFDSDDDDRSSHDKKKGKDKTTDSPRSKDKKDTSRSDKSKGGSDTDRGQGKDKTKEAKSKQEQEDDKKDSQADRDVKQLFKVSKQLIDEPEAQDVLIRTLVKKSHKQRMETKSKFKEAYNLDLDKELKAGLGSDWDVIVDALLTEQDLEDAERLHNAIQSKKACGIVEIIATKDNKSLSALKDVYRKEYSKSVESAISEKSEDPVELLLNTLAKTDKDESTEVDGKTAQKDAVELFEFGDGRWTTASGKFIKMVDSKSVAHIKTVLTLYKQVSGGKDALDTMKSECPEEYAEAVSCYVNSTKDPHAFYAEKLFKNMGSSNAVFVNTLVARSEIDLPTVCKSYKENYDADVTEDIDDRCKQTTRKVLKALASKGPKPKKGGADGKQGGKKDSKQNDGATIKADENFNPDEDCEKLRKAMEGFGTDEQIIIDIICSKNNSQRQTLKQTYADKYKKDLTADLKSELSGDFEEVILGLMMTPVEYDVHCFHEAMSGVGTDESMLTTLLATKTPAEIKAIKTEYKKVYEKELDNAIESDTSGEYRELLLALSKGDRPQGSTVKKKEAEEDAKKIHMDGKGKPSEDVFKQLMTKKSAAQVKATFEEYKRISGKDIYKTMKKSLKGDAEDAYITLGKVGGSDEVTFYTEQLHDAADGLGTNDSRLIRIIITRSEIDLGTIKRKYKNLYKKSLNEMVESECSGDYKKALNKVIGENHEADEDENGANDKNTKKPKGKSTKNTAVIGTHANNKSSNKDHGKSSNKTKDESYKDNEHKKKESKDDKSNNSQSEEIKTSKNSTQTGKGKAKEKGDVNSKNDNQDTDEPGKDEEKALDDEVERLYKAMDGLGTDEETIIDVIATKKNEERQELRKKYEERYKKDVMKDLKSELSGDLQEVILGLMMTSSAYDVDCLHEAMSGMGTDESMLIGVLATRNPEEMQTIKDMYKSAYKNDLEKDIKKETSGDFKELLLELTKGQKPQGDDVDEKISEDEAKKLYKDGKGKLDMKHVKSTFTSYNGTQVKAIFDEYEKISGKDINKVIDENFKGDAKQGYTCLLKSFSDPLEFYVDRLHDAFDGLGTNDSRLIRVVVSRSEIDLPAIKEKYKEVHSKSLPEMIQSECSGDYKKALLVVVGDE